MNEQHPRYREVPLEACCQDCPEGGTPLKIILFFRNDKLRKHTLKHLTNTVELEEVWKGLLSIHPYDIFKCIDMLRDLGCPFYNQQANFPNPPCLNNGRTCQLFDRCTYVISDLEKEYLTILEKAIRKGGQIPRYVCFEDPGGSAFFWILPDRKMIIKAMRHGTMYNVMTFHIPRSYSSWQQALDYEKRKISQQASGNTIIWCNESTWEITSGIEPKKKEQKEGSPKKFSKIVKQPYKRNRFREWPDYYEEQEE